MKGGQLAGAVRDVWGEGRSIYLLDSDSYSENERLSSYRIRTIREAKDGIKKQTLLKNSLSGKGFIRRGKS